MKRDQELDEFYRELRDVGEKNPMKGVHLSHKSDKGCNEELIVDYVAGVLSPAESAVAEGKIFSCGRCTALAVELAKGMRNFPEDKALEIDRDVVGFETWKKWFAARNSYDIAKLYDGINLRFEGVKGWDARIHNAKPDYRVRIGEKMYVPDVTGVIQYPDSVDAILESSKSPSVNIRVYAGVSND
ncbi:MAG: hypothetical protein PHV33_13160 [Elusimicrobiales bacterium]|nr:hypothetical protein [Elusimicrobiales bacterium]